LVILRGSEKPRASRRKGEKGPGQKRDILNLSDWEAKGNVREWG